jgi:hypothetical protein
LTHKLPAKISEKLMEKLSMRNPGVFLASGFKAESSQMSFCESFLSSQYGNNLGCSEPMNHDMVSRSFIGPLSFISLAKNYITEDLLKLISFMPYLRFYRSLPFYGIEYFIRCLRTAPPLFETAGGDANPLVQSLKRNNGLERRLGCRFPTSLSKSPRCRLRPYS